MLQLDTATSTTLNRKAVCIAALHTFKREDLGTGTATRSLVGEFYGLLMTLGTKPSFDGIKLLFFLFEVIDVCKDRAYEDDKHK